MPAFATCAACHGFVADLRAACVHCGAPPPRRRSFARVLATFVFGVSSMVTLMACYGMTADSVCATDPSRCDCTTDSQCEIGEYCRTAGASGTCTYGGTCARDEDCSPGYRCDESRDTCEPAPTKCETHDDCVPGEQRCDAGTCKPAASCGVDNLCGVGARCDAKFDLCIPCEGAACGTCSDQVFCAARRPACPSGTRAAVEAGCYTGACIPEAVCSTQRCSPLAEAACIADAGCDPSYRGVHCRNPSGGACTPQQPGCVCQSYEFEACVPAP